MEIERKLATIRKIREIQPIKNADRLELALVDGWQVVVQKGIHQVNDLIVFFEIDSFLPVEHHYEFLRKACFKSTKNLGDGFRIKTIKLRGEISQGLIMPLGEYCFYNYRPKEGDDVTEIFNVKKYEKPEINSEGHLAHLASLMKGYFPSFIPKTDEPRIQNLRIRDVEPYLNDTFEETIKVDGASMTVYNYQGEFGVCSRNYDMKESEENTYWQVANKLNLKELLLPGIALQGELAGPGINKNHARLEKHDFYIFNIYDIDNHKYFNPEQRRSYTAFNNLNHVPVLESQIKLPSNKEALEMANKVTFNGHSGEGIVFKSNEHPNFSFKTISNKYLLATEE